MGKKTDWVEVMKQLNSETSRHLNQAKLAQTEEMQNEHLRSAELLERAASLVEAAAE